jgi:hypothetical protein
MEWEMTRSMKQERAAQRLREWETNDRLARAADAAAKSWLEDPKSARELLLDPDLFPKLLADIAKAGLVGEKGNALATYIVATSRIREKPLNEIIKGKSSGGKNFVAKTVLKFLPEDEVVSASGMTKHALDYAGPDRFTHKLVYIDEHVGVAHPLRQLISEGRLIRLASVMENGVRVMKEFVSQGPVSCITTTTANALAIDDENRNLSIWIDESYRQTQEIAKAHVAKQESLRPERLHLWHLVQHRIADLGDIGIETPRWFVDIAEKILPYGDLRIRRYWPAFVEACRLVALIRAAAWPKPDDEITVSFDDFATALCIFDRLIGDSLTRSGGDAEMAIAELVERLSGGKDTGIRAADLVGQQGVRSLDQAYRALRRAREAGAVYIVNEHDRNNEKRYARSPMATFLGTPEYIVNKLGLKISGRYVHPLSGKRIAYGK